MVTRGRFWVISCLFVLLSDCFVFAAESENQSAQSNNSAGQNLEPLSYQSSFEFKETKEEYDARMKWWRDGRYSIIFCWGPVSLTGKEIGWSRVGERRDGYGQSAETPTEIYDNLYRHFLPSEFDAKEWVQIAKDCGFKYVSFLTKHHDGFCMWDTKTTDYKITSPLSPFGRDIAKELADACHEADMPLVWYYSLGDWHHPDYYTENQKRFDDYVLEQIRELCTNYGKIAGIQFDLAYGRMYENNMPQKLCNLIHSLQPGAYINNRGGMAGDFDTPEQRIGAFQINRPWETYITLGDQWAWKPHDNIKSFEDCIYILVNTVGGDGNLQLSSPPMPDGRLEPRQVERMKEVGAWLKKYGESIYATRGGPFMPGDYGSSTHKDNKIYLHVLDWDDESISLPPIDKKVINSFLLTGGKVNVKQTDDEITVSVDKQYQQSPDTIVVLELDGLANEITPVHTSFGSLAFEKKASASSFSENNEPAKAFDGDDKVGWIAEAGATQGWLEVDLGKTQKVAQAIIFETYPGRIKEFELQYKVDGKWESLYSGTGLGMQAVIRFKPVQAQHIRLNILKADDAPGILEMKLTGPLAAAAKEYKMQEEPVSDEIWAGYLEQWVKVGAFDVHQNRRQYGPDKLFGGQAFGAERILNWRWIADKADKDGVVWLDVDFGHSRTYNQALIHTDRYWKMMRKFELQQLVNGQWQSFYSNEELNKTSGNVTLNFDPVTISQLRMKITMVDSATLETSKFEFSEYRDTIVCAYRLDLLNTNETEK